jgi:hypothetical protein
MMAGAMTLQACSSLVSVGEVGATAPKKSVRALGQRVLSRVDSIVTAAQFLEARQGAANQRELFGARPTLELRFARPGFHKGSRDLHAKYCNWRITFGGSTRLTGTMIVKPLREVL